MDFDFIVKIIFFVKTEQKSTHKKVETRVGNHLCATSRSRSGECSSGLTLQCKYLALGKQRLKELHEPEPCLQLEMDLLVHREHIPFFSLFSELFPALCNSPPSEKQSLQATAQQKIIVLGRLRFFFKRLLSSNELVQRDLVLEPKVQRRRQAGKAAQP
ncbi:hypothetical protein KIL84_018082 [Mauremys mutica]|uniref:Uncharacterized protein n=1 Tax=Mauremys mutica TaxID=74926 RepID=A0A9D3XTZ9_9SAUR|nr:hypothetical protein KIL84_018082 [Mauremys mutica]